LTVLMINKTAMAKRTIAISMIFLSK